MAFFSAMRAASLRGKQESCPYRKVLEITTRRTRAMHELNAKNNDWSGQDVGAELSARIQRHAPLGALLRGETLSVTLICALLLLHVLLLGLFTAETARLVPRCHTRPATPHTSRKLRRPLSPSRRAFAAPETKPLPVIPERLGESFVRALRVVFGVQ